MAIYYYLPTIGTVISVTIFVIFLSKALGHPKATVLNAALLAILSTVIVYVAEYMFSEALFALPIIWVLQFFLIKALYPGSFLDTAIFFFFGLIFPVAFAFYFSEFFTETLVQYLNL
ncbi:MAG: hypothetical protein NUV67_00605 [archaeon]|nr:hypothetical protein [archaeon]